MLCVNQVCEFHVENVDVFNQLNIPYEITDHNVQVDFQPDNHNIFNKLINKLVQNDVLSINDAMEIIYKAYCYFDNYSINMNIGKIIRKYIRQFYNKTTEDFWNKYTDKKDYNLYIYEKRRLPYFNLESKEWLQANITAQQRDYPSELMRNLKETEDKFDNVKDELVSSEHNFLEWCILPISEYPDLSIMINYIKMLYAMDLEEYAIKLFVSLLLSPEYCHIVKEPDIWDIFTQKLKANKKLEQVVQYCCYYAMNIIRHEETVMFSKINNLNTRVLFTLEQAHAMYNFSHAHLERNPYIQQLTGGHRVSVSMPYYLTGSRKINSQEEFQRRFNLATGGIFTGLDFEKIQASITGSILIPLVHKSPLEDNFINSNFDRKRQISDNLYHEYMIDTPSDKKDIEFLNYLEYYYPSYVSLTDHDYKNDVLQLEENIKEVDELVYDEDIDDAETMPSVVEVKETKEAKEPIDKSEIKIAYNKLADIDISITTSDLPMFKKRAKILYDTIVTNSKHRGPVYIQEITTVSSVKYKIYGPGIPRPIDIFRIPYGPAKMVKKFHVPAVKMFYNGHITMFRSCVSALLSGANDRYSWFSCNKIPIDVIMKYAQRGISTILNPKEVSTSTEFFKNKNLRWGKLIEQISDGCAFCIVGRGDPFFRPGLFHSGIRLHLRSFEGFQNQPEHIKYVCEYPTDLPVLKSNNKLNRPDYLAVLSQIEDDI